MKYSKVVKNTILFLVNILKVHTPRNVNQIYLRYSKKDNLYIRNRSVPNLILIFRGYNNE